MPLWQTSSSICTAAARKAAPQATQTADRFHIYKNLTEAVERTLALCRAEIRQGAFEALSEEERTAYRDELARSVRSKRNSLIAETDWMALSDNTISPAWASYRQALRDITAQEGFPYAVQWPEKPE